MGDRIHISDRQWEEYVARYGSQRAISRATGIHRDVLRRKKLQYDSGERDEAATPSALIAYEKAKTEECKKRIRELEIENRMAAQAIAAARKAKAADIKPATLKSIEGQHLRITLADLHGQRMHKPTVSALMTDLAYLAGGIEEIILLGDMLECGGWLAQRHALGYVSELDHSYEEDVAATNWFLDMLQKTVPGARVGYLEGNHEHRIEKWIVTETLRHRRDSNMLRNMLGPQVVLSLDRRNIAWYAQGEQHDGLPVLGTIRRGKMFFTHGFTTAKHAASVTVQKIGGNVRYGHTHRRDYYTVQQVATGEIAALCPGCLCERLPVWQHSAPNDWTRGYGLDIVREDGGFLPLNVPIIDGQSYLAPLVDMIKGG